MRTERRVLGCGTRSERVLIGTYSTNVIKYSTNVIKYSTNFIKYSTKIMKILTLIRCFIARTIDS